LPEEQHSRETRTGSIGFYFNDNNFSKWSPNTFNTVNDEKPIEIVRDYPVLYELSDKNYKDNNIKENVRKVISIVIGKSGKSNTYQCHNVNNVLSITRNTITSNVHFYFKIEIKTQKNIADGF